MYIKINNYFIRYKIKRKKMKDGPLETNPVEAKQVEAKPTQIEQPAQTGQVQANPVEAEPVKAEPIPVEPGPKEASNQTQEPKEEGQLVCLDFDNTLVNGHFHNKMTTAEVNKEISPASKTIQAGEKYTPNEADNARKVAIETKTKTLLD